MNHQPRFVSSLLFSPHPLPFSPFLQLFAFLVTRVAGVLCSYAGATELKPTAYGKEEKSSLPVDRKVGRSSEIWGVRVNQKA
ncbi:hypothetical protein B0H14DRAFT_3060668, partial [Mycena olivaceomarginata]